MNTSTTYILAKREKKNRYLNDKIAKKILKNDKYGKEFCARIISHLLNLNYEDVLSNLHNKTKEIAFSSLTVNSTADAIYQNNYIIFDIEVNFHYTISKPAQLRSYTYQLYLSQLNTYEDYNRIKEVIQISLDNYDLVGNNQFIYKSYLMEESTHQKIDDKITIYNLNLAYLKNVDYNLIIENELMKDLYFLVCEDTEILRRVYEGDSLMGKIIKETKKIAGQEKMHLYLTDEEMMKLDEEFIRNQSFNEGIQEGTLSEKKNVIFNMLKDNISIDVIAKYVNLDVSNVEKIIKTLEN